MPEEPQPPDPQPGDIPCSCGWPMRWSERGYALLCPRCDLAPTATTGPPIRGGPSV